MTSVPHCLGCGAPLEQSFLDLGEQPLSNALIRPDQADAAEPVYPLHARVCTVCLLVQVDRVVPPDAIFHSDYAYFSSFSESWLAHCSAYASEMIKRFDLDHSSLVVEIASNDGYLLQYFAQASIPVLGIEPSANTAEFAMARGIPTEIRFFGKSTAEFLVARGQQADLLAAKNVMAHVPDINDFVSGIAPMLKPEGVFTVEFPHLLRLIQEVQFDTIYHEHFTYLSLIAVKNIFERNGLRVFDVIPVPTHGGSLRVFACRDAAPHSVLPSVDTMLEFERAAGLDRPEGYTGMTARAELVRTQLLTFLKSEKAAGRKTLAYGAAAKGNTLLNYCGIGPELLPFVADRSPQKQGRLCPGSHIPIVTPEALLASRPDTVLVLPWNILPEVESQLSSIRTWGGKFAVAIPELRLR